MFNEVAHFAGEAWSLVVGIARQLARAREVLMNSIINPLGKVIDVGVVLPVFIALYGFSYVLKSGGSVMGTVSTFIKDRLTKGKGKAGATEAAPGSPTPPPGAAPH